MKIIFSHGKESGPFGYKIKQLISIAQEYGIDSDSIDYSGIDSADERAVKLIKYLSDYKDNDYTLVGSSMGAYVSLVAAEKSTCKALFLMAPAVYIDGYAKQKFADFRIPVHIVHGYSDEVVPLENVLKFAKTHKLNLHLIDGDHRLTSSIEKVKAIFRLFLNEVLNQ